MASFEDSETSLSHLSAFVTQGATSNSACLSVDPLLYRRIFVNRTLPMDQMDAIGFDMDYTLALYRKPNMEVLALRCVLKKLVDARGYSPEILDLSYDTRFPIRGLAVDRRGGNLLKIDRYGSVHHGFHGSTALSPGQRSHLYQNQRISFTYPDYAWIDTLYSLPEATLFTTLVDFVDEQQRKGAFEKEALPLHYTKLWQDIRECADESHRDNTLNSVICKNLSTYLEQDAELSEMLHRFRCAGKKLFLLTNSGQPYADAVMSYLLNGKHPEYSSWHQYFDMVVVDAKKPSFFTEHRAFSKTEITPSVEGTPSKTKSASFAIYHGGNAHDLQNNLSVQGHRILYIGDHIYGDILKLKKSCVWRTALVIQELEQELILQAELKPELQRLEKLERRRMRIDAELTYQHAMKHTRWANQQKEIPVDANDERKERLQSMYQQIVLEMAELEASIYRRFHPHWGPVFKAGTENSLFGEQVKAYACVYTSKASNFLAYSPLQSFHPPREHLPHERVY